PAFARSQEPATSLPLSVLAILPVLCVSTAARPRQAVLPMSPKWGHISDCHSALVAVPDVEEAPHEPIPVVVVRGGTRRRGVSGPSVAHRCSLLSDSRRDPQQWQPALLLAAADDATAELHGNVRRHARA